MSDIIINLIHEAEFIDNHLRSKKLDPLRWNSRLIKADGYSKVYRFTNGSAPPGNIQNQTVIEDEDILWYQIDLSNSVILRDMFPFYEDSAYNFANDMMDHEGNPILGPSGGVRQDRIPLEGTLSLPYFWFVRGDGILIEHGAGDELGERGTGEQDDGEEGEYDWGGDLADMELDPYIAFINPANWDNWEVDPYAATPIGQNRWKGAPSPDNSFIKTMAGKNVRKIYKGIKTKAQVRSIMAEWREEKIRRALALE